MPQKNMEICCYRYCRYCRYCRFCRYCRYCRYLREAAEELGGILSVHQQLQRGLVVDIRHELFLHVRRQPHL